MRATAWLHWMVQGRTGWSLTTMGLIGGGAWLVGQRRIQQVRLQLAREQRLAAAQARLALVLENTTDFYVHPGFPAVAHRDVVWALETACRDGGHPYHVGLTATGTWRERVVKPAAAPRSSGRTTPMMNELRSGLSM